MSFVFNKFFIFIAFVLIIIGCVIFKFLVNSTVTLYFNSTDTVYSISDVQLASVRTFLFIRNMDSDSQTGCYLIDRNSSIDFQFKSCVAIEINDNVKNYHVRTDLDVEDNDRVHFDLVRESLVDKTVEKFGSVASSVVSASVKHKGVKFASGLVNSLVGGDAYNVDSSLLNKMKVSKLIFLERFSYKSPNDITLVFQGDNFNSKGRNINIKGRFGMGLEYISLFSD
ncbi:hypothetical protein [Aliamphritea hakodatensis]|uniref:hypothetical protein n=1 Tax=Aliamphritea hakodatensis TaxID=2895352 RepID=UPI0022FDA8B3|nr:hypothetical protein [Aliamphritea hakodatensis]